MRQLDRVEQRILAHSLLKRFHPEAVATLGETFSDEEGLLLSRFDAFRLIEDAKSVSMRQLSGGPKLASRSKLRRTILVKFTAKFGNQCLGLDVVGLGPELDFKIKQCGWILNTHFEFDGTHRQIHYWHDIVSPTTIEPYGMPAMVLGQFISFNAWLGLSSQTQWECLLADDVEPACDTAIKFCGRFLDVAPKLLKGLEVKE